ncbi:oligosaccharide repeat unit polymerase [Gordonia McavH-238-E]|uniref:O-antigen polymerase n=1 Tax=Gordonia sp. McavH-238-E TaxID=2917736 RepID=UPI001EF4934E|nr:O-antigen polymerase [Gordonia sp. McavH-238-E]MCG7631546.1 oligosaccharide repeat unit polymerase [Gordonia sp. McavH-238-E]
MSDMTQSLAWFNLIVGTAAILWETRLRVGALLSPFSVAMFMLVSIFAIRPLLIVDDPDHLFYGFQVSDGFSASALVGTIAILALGCGYAIANLAEDRHASGRSRPARQAAPSTSAFANEVGGASSTRLGLLAAAGLCLWALAMTAAGGASFLSAMVGGRSAEVSESLVNLPIVFYCLPAGVVFAAAFWRVCREREFGALRGRDALVYWVTVAAGVVPPAFLGNRRFILPCVIAALLAAVLGGRRWSERVGLIRFAVGLVGFLAIATLPFVRSAGSRDPDSNLLGAMMTYVSDQGVTGVASNYFRSYDTEMFDYIALVSPDLGGDVPYGYGRGTLVDLVTSVVPARLLSTPSWSDQILDTLFDATCGTGICPVPSIAGTAYFDFGFLGVAAIALALGVFCYLFKSRFRGLSGVSLLVVLVLGSFTITFVRGNFPAQAWIAANVIVIAALASWVLTIGRVGPQSIIPGSSRTPTTRQGRTVASRRTQTRASVMARGES